jgi:chromosome segregation ATPase
MAELLKSPELIAAFVALLGALYAGTRKLNTANASKSVVEAMRLLVDELQEERGGLVERVTKLESAVAEQGRQIEKLRDELLKTRAERDLAVADRDRLLMENRALNERVEHLEARVQELEMEIAKLEGDAL